MLSRLSGLGATAGLVALILWPLQSGWRDSLFWPLLGAAAAAGLCGLAVLLLTAADILFHRRRGERIRPVRAFDIALAAALVALALLQLGDLRGQLPA